MIEMQDIIRRHGSDFLETHMLSPVQWKAFRAIRDCRTAVLGAHIDTCDKCGFEKISYNSCRNRHCPKCQGFAREEWVEKQNQYLLRTNYFHVVFTLPDTLNAIAYQNQELVYGLFFKAVSETLLELCANKKRLGAKPGITAVLHTWGQNLSYHPHIHCIVTGGGLTVDNQWKHSRKKFFLPIKVLSRKFRGKFLHFLKNAKLFFGESVSNLREEKQFEAFIAALQRKEWVVYCKPPFKNASKVISYLGRYTHRVAISNNRILNLENGRVTFSWRDYSDGNKTKRMTISAVEFIRRFLMHVLPPGFRKIRRFGILAARNKTQRITLCRKLTNTRIPAIAAVAKIELLRMMLGTDFDLCPACGVGHLSRASPARATA